uniref:Riboflavin-aldehyde forming enzyme n=1 Tax=Agaricus bisporus TaxID=5341 RepID=Q5W1H8_AGABI|nr:riboflavin-aldehyde forming enzyme [Agaricus bisporus]
MKFSNSLSALLVSANLMLAAKAYKGDATFYDPGLGACGHTNQAHELVVALPSAKYGNGDHCSKHVGIHYKGKYVKVKVVDKCPGCGSNDLDISPTAFSQLASQDLGRIKVDWEFI